MNPCQTVIMKGRNCWSTILSSKSLLSVRRLPLFVICWREGIVEWNSIEKLTFRVCLFSWNMYSLIQPLLYLKKALSLRLVSQRFFLQPCQWNSAVELWQNFLFKLACVISKVELWTWMFIFGCTNFQCFEDVGKMSAETFKGRFALSRSW